MSEASQPLNALPQGYRLQEYELVRVLGFGGFGMTYLGFDHNLDKPIAIKEYLPSDIATRTVDRSVAPQASEVRGDFQWGLERFVDEARTLARFDHRHIIKVHRFFEAHGTAYIVMEYAEGETLSAHLERKGSLSEAELKAMLYPLLDGLAVVHGADFLHRDIKPGNIVLRDADGSPVLLDFGAARQAIGAKSRSVTSIVTPGYAPIEQYSTRGRQGAWTDVYALGGVCYRALTGDVPADATDRVRDDPLVPVSQRCAGRASASFLSAVDWALSVDEGDRPQGVGAWRAAIGGATAASAVDEVPSAGRVEQETTEQEKVEGTPSVGRAAMEAVVLYLVKRGWFVNARGQKDGFTVLHWAARGGSLAVMEALVDQGANVDAMSTSGYTALHNAAWRGRLSVVKYLVGVGADVNAKGSNGLTALSWAARAGHLAVVKFLVGAGADVLGSTALHTAAGSGHLEMVELLVGAGADVNAKIKADYYGSTALHFAAWRGHLAVVKFLVGAGTDVNATGGYRGETALHRAAYWGHFSVVQYLVGAGADVRATNRFGASALHVAAWYRGHLSLVKFLVGSGADVSATNNGGRTPRDVAAVWGRTEVVSYFDSLAADE